MSMNEVYTAPQQPTRKSRLPLVLGIVGGAIVLIGAIIAAMILLFGSPSKMTEVKFASDTIPTLCGVTNIEFKVGEYKNSTANGVSTTIIVYAEPVDSLYLQDYVKALKGQGFTVTQDGESYFQLGKQSIERGKILLIDVANDVFNLEITYRKGASGSSALGDSAAPIATDDAAPFSDAPDGLHTPEPTSTSAPEPTREPAQESAREPVVTSAPDAPAATPAKLADASSLSSNWEDFEFIFDGKKRSLPLKYNDLKSAGWTFSSGFDRFNNGYSLDPWQSVGAITLDNPQYSGYYILLSFINNSKVAKDILECDIHSFSYEMTGSSKNYPEMIIVGGLTFGNSVKQVQEVFGTECEIEEYEFDGDIYKYADVISSSGAFSFKFNKYEELEEIGLRIY